jgi:phenylpyruvate tautomerase PptA (4-oxalocrotonate tautomerase family)
MPVYIVYSSTGQLSPDAKKEVAHAITEAHHALTGTHSFMAQVIFQEQQPGNVFVGGIPQGTANIFVHGMNRLGRSTELKRDPTRRIVADVSKAASTPTRNIWVYIDELPATQMAEYGHLLPQPGQESEWVEGLPAADREYMESTVLKKSPMA